MKYAIAIAATTLTMVTAMAPPASAAWYFRNYCAWDASSRCAAKRAEAAKTGRQMPKATTCFGRSC
jgi:hypothetical protein